jgi:hypothetical protein
MDEDGPIYHNLISGMMTTDRSVAEMSVEEVIAVANSEHEAMEHRMETTLVSGTQLPFSGDFASLSRDTMIVTRAEDQTTPIVLSKKQEKELAKMSLERAREISGENPDDLPWKDDEDLPTLVARIRSLYIVKAFAERERVRRNDQPLEGSRLVLSEKVGSHGGRFWVNPTWDKSKPDEQPMTPNTKARLAQGRADRLATFRQHYTERPYRPPIEAGPIPPMNEEQLDDAVKMLMRMYERVPAMRRVTEDDAYELLRNA